MHHDQHHPASSGGNLAPQCSWHLIKRLVNLLVATWRSNIMAPLHLFAGIIFGSNLALRTIRLLLQRWLQCNARDIITEHCRFHLLGLHFICDIYIRAEGCTPNAALEPTFSFFFPPFSTFQNYHIIQKLWFELYMDNIHFNILLLEYSNNHFYYFLIE